MGVTAPEFNHTSSLRDVHAFVQLRITNTISTDEKLELSVKVGSPEITEDGRLNFWREEKGRKTQMKTNR